jgi:hypothetical protein
MEALIDDKELFSYGGADLQVWMTIIYFSALNHRGKP